MKVDRGIPEQVCPEDTKKLDCPEDTGNVHSASINFSSIAWCIGVEETNAANVGKA